MKLGSVNTVIIHTEEDKKEVLVTKGDHFDGRPDWKRFDFMFGGSRRNGGASYQWNFRTFLLMNTVFSSGILRLRRFADCEAETAAGAHLPQLGR